MGPDAGAIPLGQELASAHHLPTTPDAGSTLERQRDAGPDMVDGDGNWTSPELLENPGFEDGHDGWVGFGSSRVLDVTEAHSGSAAILSANRAQRWEGPSLSINALVEPAQPYALSAWVRNETGTHEITLTLLTACGASVEYSRLATRVGDDEWFHLDASFLAPTCSDPWVVELSVAGPPRNSNFLVDDVSLRAMSFSEGDAL